MFDVISLIIGFVPLFWGANILVDGSSALVKKTGVSNFSIGLTIVAFGTATPEMSVNIFAAARHDNFITMGNVLGSNIFNVCVVLGIIASLFPVVVKSRAIKVETIVAFMTGLVILVLAKDQFFKDQEFNIITRREGIFLLLLFGVYVVFLVRSVIKRNVDNDLSFTNSKISSIAKVAMGLALLIAGGQLIVYSAQNLSDYLNISERIVALIFISAGTSLPELATAIVAARKGNTELILGNMIGSNIFNGFLVLGISALINPVRITVASQYDIVIHFVVSCLLLLFLVNKPSVVKRINGGVLFAIYLAFVFYLFVLMN